jgi:hypothetical protein
MLKDYESDSDVSAGPSGSSDAAGVSARGGGKVYCFVSTAELRRLLSLLAGTELLADLVRAFVRSPAAEVTLPPTLL